MINFLRLQRFKCFTDLTVPITPLTILAGANNTGKSTVIQSLLLLRQAVQLRKKVFPLNGNLVRMGTGSDVFCQWANEDSIKLNIGFDDSPDTFSWKLAYTSKEEKSFSLKIIEKPRMNLSKKSLFDNRFSYIGADRLGPQLVYPVGEVSEDLLHVGYRGEYVVHCLEKLASRKIKNQKLKFSMNDSSEAFSFQTERWINYLIPDIKFNYSHIKDADMLTVSIGSIKKGKDLKYLRPTNFGFGIMYCLPVVVAGLMSERESLIILENPEAHLHPRAQSRLGEFFCRLAAAGVQIILETHSDHILNGIRLCVKNNIVDPEDVSINYFQENYKLCRPEIDADGRIDIWPDGFFDQFEKDLQELI